MSDVFVFYTRDGFGNRRYMTTNGVVFHTHTFIDAKAARNMLVAHDGQSWCIGVMTHTDTGCLSAFADSLRDLASAWHADLMGVDDEAETMADRHRPDYAQGVLDRVVDRAAFNLENN